MQCGFHCIAGKVVAHLPYLHPSEEICPLGALVLPRKEDASDAGEEQDNTFKHVVLQEFSKHKTEKRGGVI